MIGAKEQYTAEYELRLEALRKSEQLTASQKRELALYDQRVRKRKSRANKLKIEQQIKEDCSLEMVG